MSMSAGVIRSWVQDIETRAIRAHDLLARDAQEDPGMTERAVAAVASHGAGIYPHDFRRCQLDSNRGRVIRWGSTVRHFDPLSGRESSMMIAMRRMPSTILL